MPRYERHIFVCGNQREPAHPRGCCSAKGSDGIREALKSELRKRGLNATMRVNQAGCLDQCEHGVTVVVYPEAVWYGFVKLEDVPELVESHLVAGRPVERLRLAETCINTKSCPHRGAPQAT